MRRLWALVVGLAVLTVSAGTASAGGAWFSFEERYYRVGDEVVGTVVTHGGTLGWVEDGPFYAYLLPGEVTRVPAFSAIRLGPVELEDAGNGGVRATVAFVMPDVPSGEYFVGYCNDPCTEGLGDIIGGYVRVLGAPAPRLAPVLRRWGAAPR